jgi:glyoxylase-like metal-dependent hydrolase (beta-lactamase superfamily II)
VNHGGIAAVDTQFPDPAKLFLSGLPGRNGRKVDVLINSHHHADHTSGNKVFQPETKVMAAQENVPGLQKAAAAINNTEADQVYATTLFAKEWKTSVGDENIHTKYFGPAHTNGDSIIRFEKADVIHMGDLVFNRIYPVIDRRAGASIRNWVTILEQVANMCGVDTIFIFGHGNPKFGVSGNAGDLMVQRDYFNELLAYTETKLAAGETREQIAAGIDNMPGFPDFHAPKPNRLANNLEIAFDELSAEKKSK